MTSPTTIFAIEHESDFMGVAHHHLGRKPANQLPGHQGIRAAVGSGDEQKGLTVSPGLITNS
jgi:hypothetical protein